jgi:hypothetical protein
LRASDAGATIKLESGRVMADKALNEIVLQSPNGQYRMQISMTDSGALEARLLLPDGKGGWKPDQRACKPLALCQKDQAGYYLR